MGCGASREVELDHAELHEFATKPPLPAGHPVLESLAEALAKKYKGDGSEVQHSGPTPAERDPVHRWIDDMKETRATRKAIIEDANIYTDLHDWLEGDVDLDEVDEPKVEFFALWVKIVEDALMSDEDEITVDLLKRVWNVGECAIQGVPSESNAPQQHGAKTVTQTTVTQQVIQPVAMQTIPQQLHVDTTGDGIADTVVVQQVPVVPSAACTTPTTTTTQTTTTVDPTLDRAAAKRQRKKIFEREWSQLTQEQRDAAMAMGCTAQAWDEDADLTAWDTDWDDLQPHQREHMTKAFFYDKESWDDSDADDDSVSDDD